MRKQPQPLPEEYRNGTLKPAEPSPMPPTKDGSKKLTSINILGINYSITYCDNPSEVDIYKRESLWGQVDYWTRTIRVYDNGRSIQDIWQTIIHEILHVIGEGLKLECLNKGCFKDDRKHEELDILASTLVDTLFRNDLIKIGLISEK